MHLTKGKEEHWCQKLMQCFPWRVWVNVSPLLHVFECTCLLAIVFVSNRLLSCYWCSLLLLRATEIWLYHVRSLTVWPAHCQNTYTSQQSHTSHAMSLWPLGPESISCVGLRMCSTATPSVFLLLSFKFFSRHEDLWILSSSDITPVLAHHR